MLKPYIIFNGYSYFILCQEPEFDVSLIGIDRDKVLYLDIINDNEIMNISYSHNIKDFNSVIEEKYTIALDIFIDTTFRLTEILPTPFFEIISEYSDGDDTITVNHNFNDLNEYILDYDDYYFFNINEYYKSIDEGKFFRSYLIINIPSLVLSRNPDVEIALRTFFSVDELEKMRYDINPVDNTLSMTIKTFYLHSSEALLNELLRVLDSHSTNNKHPIDVSVVNTDHPAIRSVGEVYINLTFDMLYAKRQLLAIFMNLKALIENDSRITIFY